MRQLSVPVALLALLVVCGALAATATPAYAAAPHTLQEAKAFVANDGAFTNADVRVQQQQNAWRMERSVGLRATPTAADAAATVEELAVGAGASFDSSSDTRTAAEKYGTILAGGVIASVTVVLVFACVLVVLVMIEIGTSVAEYLEQRRMRAYRLSKSGDDPAEPKYGDFRDTAVNVQV